MQIAECEARIEELASAIVDEAAELAAKIHGTIRKPLMSSAMVLRFCAGSPDSAIAMRLHITRDYVWKLCKRGVKLMTGAE